MAWPKFEVRKDEPLEGAYRRTIEAVTAAGGRPYEPESLNSLISSKAFGRIFNVFSADTNQTFYICTGKWDEATTLNVLNDLLRLSMTPQQVAPGRALFTFVSAYPVPRALLYIFADTLRGRLESMCMARLKIPDLLKTSDMPRVAETSAAILRELFADSPRLDNLATAEKVDTIVLHEMRGELDYTPDYSLLALGSVVGEMIRRNPMLDARWVSSESALMNLALETKLKTGGPGITLNPLGKVYKLYQNGAVDAVSPFIAAVLQHLMKAHGVQ